ncbi:flavin reductase family protein [Pseudomonas sp. PLB05]|uniref:flavin reductase family protein n=1 Tax=Pseudomonas sp. PLB05 TaxID=2899078 RepID=UPI001E402F0E|nr:flavin reductase [Pseudomonas sp. PLB05]MCD4863823.1 flavin reductase [Pseudomonas sp. PLB05]
MDKFKAFGLAAVPAVHVRAPLIGECYANFECQLADDRQIDEYGLFIWEIVKGHVASNMIEPETLHYRGHGEFRVAGPVLDFNDRFKPQNL